MKVLITGAEGMLGTDLSQQLSAKFDVLGIDRRAASHSKIPCHLVDLRSAGAVEDFFRKEKPDVVFHCAAMTDVDACESQHETAVADNVEATKNLYRACKQNGTFLIFISTDYVFDGKKQGEYLETDSPNPSSFYGKTKYEAERFLQKEKGLFMIVRTCWLYGLRGRSFPKAILAKAAETETLQVVSDQIGHPTYTQDLAKAFYQILQKGPETLKRYAGEVFHIANQGSCSWADFAREILSVASKKNVSVKEITSAQLNRPAPRPANSVLSLMKAEQQLEIKLRPWQDAIHEFIPLLLQEQKGIMA